MNTDLAIEKIQFLKALDALIDYHHQTRARIEAAEVKTGEKKMSFDWAGFAVRILTNVPVIVSGIEQIHGQAKSGAEKKQLAMEALGLAYGTASVSDPGHQPIIDAAATMASQAIDSVVSVMNAAKSANKTPIASVPSRSESPNPGMKPPIPISPLVPQSQKETEPAGEVQKAPSGLNPELPQDNQEVDQPPAKTSLWP